MKFRLLLFFLLSISPLFSQDFFTQQLDRYFPNRKSKQIERLQFTRDSLQHISDSLDASVKVAAERIAGMKQEILTLKEDLFKEQNNAKSAHTDLFTENQRLKDSINQIGWPVVICTEETVLKKGTKDPVIVNTCQWRGFQIIEKGTPDYQGRYVWTSELFRKVGDSLVKISTTDLFKPEKMVELEKLINARLSEDFTALKTTDPECFTRRKNYPGFKLKDMRLAFSENSEITFEVSYNLTDACFALNKASTTFRLKELKVFLVE
jgi:FtsZ-binding cell division protein ZapB